MVLAASFNAHDDTLATAATSVLVSLVESADVASVLHVLAAQVKDSAALNDAVVANANARAYK